jgi:hypothetical protein
MTHVESAPEVLGPSVEQKSNWRGDGVELSLQSGLSRVTFRARSKKSHKFNYLLGQQTNAQLKVGFGSPKSTLCLVLVGSPLLAAADLLGIRVV